MTSVRHPSDDLTRPVVPVAGRRCAPGDWYAVLAPHASVLMPPAARDRVAGAWELADAGAEFDELLDHVVAAGLRDLPGLVLVGDLTDGRVRVLLRGPVRARVETPGGESRELRPEAQSWTDRALDEVASLAVVVDADAPVLPGLSVGTGIARVGGLELGATAPTGRWLAPVPAPRTEETPGRPTLSLAAGAVTTPSAPAGTLVFSTGAVVPVDRSVVVGRAPRGSSCGVATAEDARLVAVPSPRLEISATHLVVRPDRTDTVVTDLASTNGTLLLRPGQPPHELVPGLPTRLVAGDVVDLGEGVTIRVSG